jgi:hypothetical protein
MSHKHKRKRTIEEAVVDFATYKRAKDVMEALRQQLGDIEETEGDISGVMSHLDALGDILSRARQRVRILVVPCVSLLVDNVRRRSGFPSPPSQGRTSSIWGLPLNASSLIPKQLLS